MKTYIPLAIICSISMAGCLPETAPTTPAPPPPASCENCSGIVTTDIGSNYDEGWSVIQQADGKLVLVGVNMVSLNSTQNNFHLLRYNSDGSLDENFDNDGIVATDIDISVDFAHSVIQQTDGKFVVAGSREKFSNWDFSLVRYNNDGSLDTSFGGDGKVTTVISSQGDYANSIIQQADGKLVVAGINKFGQNSDFVLVRYNSDGSLDSDFDSDGIVTTSVGANNDGVYAMLQQADGKLVVAGSSHNGTSSEIALARYNSDGSLDSSFDGDGIVKIAVGFSSIAYSIIQQSDDKLVIAGSTININSSEYDLALLRFNLDGSLDNSFDGDGIVITDIGDDDKAYSLIQQIDGKLAVSGYSDNGSKKEFSLVRYNSDGSLDNTLVGDAGLGNGIVTTSIGTGDDSALSILQQTDGKLVLAGYSGNGSNYDIALVRYNIDGTLDTLSFGPP